MNIDKDVMFYKLLSYGLFPERLNGIFSSENFGNQIANGKLSLNVNNRDKYSLLIYKLTRNNNSPRYMAIPHPLAFLGLSKKISLRWPEIENKINEAPNYSDRSMIRGKSDNKNGRLFSMVSYDKDPESEYLELVSQFGKKYFVHADISDCYGSVYTHSISWALVGKEVAKQGQGNSSLWYNKLDCAYRNIQDGETKGIPIGPDTSSIAAELILSQIDKALSKYDYIRYIDDYKCFCETKEEADAFIRDLSHELEVFKLKLNTKKTKIMDLPKAINEDWVRKLRQAIDWKEVNYFNKNKVIGFMDLSSELFAKNPGDSTIRYAVKVLKNKKYKNYSVYKLVLRYFLNLCFLYPYVLDVCDDFIEIGLDKFSNSFDEIKSILEVSLGKIIDEHIKYGRSDVVTWAIFIAIKYNLAIKEFEKIAPKVIKSQDCIPNLMCYLYLTINEKDVTSFLGLLDRYQDGGWWLFNYEVKRIEGLPIVNCVEMERLRGRKISFLSDAILAKLKDSTKTKKSIKISKGAGLFHKATPIKK